MYSAEEVTGGGSERRVLPPKQSLLLAGRQ